MSLTRRVVAFACVAAWILACACACGPAAGETAPPAGAPSPGLAIERVNFSPPQPFEGTTYVDLIGTLPDACTTIAAIDHEWQYPVLEVTIETTRPAGMACAQVLTSFRETIKVQTGNLYAGTTYQVVVNGQAFAFPWEIEFIEPLTPDPGS
jgi:hypothetical protein